MAKRSAIPTAKTPAHHTPAPQGIGAGHLPKGMHPPAGYMPDVHHAMAMQHMARANASNFAARSAAAHARPIQRIVTVRRLP